MAQLRVTAKKLNKRLAPTTSFSDQENIIGTVARGYIFEGENTASNNLGQWYVDRDGYYYWGGGLSVISPENSVAPFLPPQTEQGKANIPFPKAPPNDLPLTKPQCLRMAEWMDEKFGDKCKTAVEDTPFTKQLLYAIACKETGIYVYKWIKDNLEEEILGRCVFDASGDVDRTRGAFPKNTDAFVAKYGQPLANELIEEANRTRALRGWGPKRWVYAGYGIFQYDLQHILTDELFFRQKLWYNIDECVDRVMKELKSKWGNNVNDLFHTIKAYNGSGPKAENYANSVLQFLDWINKAV
jgi:hypothetical protein